MTTMAIVSTGDQGDGQGGDGVGLEGKQWLARKNGMGVGFGFEMMRGSGRFDTWRCPTSSGQWPNNKCYVNLECW